MDRLAHFLHTGVDQRDDRLRGHSFRECCEATNVGEEHSDVAGLTAKLDAALDELLGNVLGDHLVQHPAFLLLKT